jgi:hypothetical protein
MYGTSRTAKKTKIYSKLNSANLKSKTNQKPTVRVVDKPEEIKALIEVGFEYVC